MVEPRTRDTDLKKIQTGYAAKFTDPCKLIDGDEETEEHYYRQTQLLRPADRVI